MKEEEIEIPMYLRSEISEAEIFIIWLDGYCSSSRELISAQPSASAEMLRKAAEKILNRFGIKDFYSQIKIET